MSDITTVEVASLDAVPEGLRALFAEKDGKFVAQIAPKAKLDEFRNTNIERGRQIDQLTEKLKGYDGLDPQQARQWRDELKQLKEAQDANKAGSTPDAIQKLVDERISSERATLKNQAEAAEAKRKEAEDAAQRAQQHLNKLAINSSVATAASAIGGFVQQAMADAIYLIEREGTVKDGVVVFLDSEGGVLPGPDGKSPKTVEDRLRETKGKEKPHWWAAAANGSGANNGNDRGAGGAKTMSRRAFDALTGSEQAQRIRDGYRVVDG